MPRTTLAIVGTGPFGQGLARLAQRTGAVYQYCVLLASRRLAPGAEPVHLPPLPDVPMVALEDALSQASVVFLALPARSFGSFVASYGQMLTGKVVVDVCNPWDGELKQLIPSALASPRPSSEHSQVAIEMMAQDAAKMCKELSMRQSSSSVDMETHHQPRSAALWLQQALQPFGVPVVKGFNNLSAYTLVHGDPLTEHMKTVLASDDEAALDTAADIARGLNIQPNLVPSLRHSIVMEGWQRELLNTWRWPTYTMFIMWLLIWIYAAIRYNHYGGVAWHHTTLFILNKSIAWTALWGLLITYMPGIMVTLTLLITRKPQIRLWDWMKRWMDGRKQLGLHASLATVIHLIMSAFLWLPSYYAKLFEHDVQVVPKLPGTTLDKYGLMKPGDKATLALSVNTTGVLAASGAASTGLVLQTADIISVHSQLNIFGELVILTGIVAGVLLGITTLTSAPGIIAKINWREWRLLQSWFGWLSLALATAHTMLLAPVPAWRIEQYTWPANIPTITLISVAPCLLLMAIKIVLECPPMPWVMRTIRAGAYKKGDVQAVFC